MAKQPIYFAAAHDRNRAPVADGAQLINAYAEKAPPGAKAGLLLHGTPGSEVFSDLPTDKPVLGCHEFKNRAIFWTADGMYEVTNTGAATELASLTIFGPVSADDNGTTMVFVDGRSGWTFDGTTVATIGDPDFHPADTVVFFDGFFVFNRSGTGQFFYSGAYATTFDALDFATAEKSPDRLVAVVANLDELWMFGTRTTEIWYNSGGTDLTFTRMPGGVIDHGLVAPAAVAVTDSTVFWLAPEGIVFQAAGGFQPTRISTHQVEADLVGRDLAGARSWTYYDEGHLFYVLNFTDRTWVFDAATMLWHRREHYDRAGGHHASCYLRAFGRHLIGDITKGEIHEMRLDLPHDNGRPLLLTAVSAPIHSNRGRSRHWSFELDVETTPVDMTAYGGDETGAAEPEAWLDWSDDGGHTWSSARRMALAREGRYRHRLVARRLGQSRDRRYRIRISDPVIRSMLATGYVEAE